MAIVAQCTNCGKKYKVAETSVGKQVRCQACQTVFVVQQPAVAAASASRGGGATTSATAASAGQNQAAQNQAALSQKYGLSPLPKNPNAVFPETAFKRRPGQADPLANHVVYDPGFAPVSVADYHATQMPKEQSMHDYMKQIEDEERGDKKREREPLGVMATYLVAGAIPIVVAIIAGIIDGLYGTEAALSVFSGGTGLILGMYIVFVTWRAILQNDELSQLLLCMFVPFYVLYYTIVNWDYMKHPFFLQLFVMPAITVGAVVFGVIHLIIDMATS